MFCIKCKYISFDYLPKCPKCGFDWSETRKRMNLDWMIEPSEEGFEESVSEKDLVFEGLEPEFSSKEEVEGADEISLEEPKPEIEFEGLVKEEVEEGKGPKAVMNVEPEGVSLEAGAKKEEDTEFGFELETEEGGVGEQKLIKTSEVESQVSEVEEEIEVHLKGAEAAEAIEEDGGGKVSFEIDKDVLEEPNLEESLREELKEEVEPDLGEIEADVSIPIEEGIEEEQEKSREDGLSVETESEGEGVDDISITLELEDVESETEEESGEEDVIGDILDIEEPSKDKDEK